MAEASGFAAALAALTRAGVEFVVVGVGGINFYAREAAAAIATLDLDLLLRPRVATLRTALSALRTAGFSFEAGGEPFIDQDDDSVLANAAPRGASISASSPEGARIDLMLSAAGVAWDDLAADGMTAGRDRVC